MRRIAFELSGLMIAAALAGMVVARVVIAQPACDAVRMAGTMLPPAALGGPASSFDEDRRAISLSSLLATAPTNNVAPGSRPTVHAALTPTPTGPDEQPSVHREGDRVHIDLHGGSANADLLAGAVVVPRDLAQGGGYIVRNVDQAGMLTAAGVVSGDVIIAVNGESTLSPDQALAAFALARNDRTITLRLQRGDRTFEVIADVVR